MAVPNIFSINIEIFSLHTKIWISSNALSITSELQVLRMELASCHASGAYNLEMAPRLLEKFMDPCY
jgi:hypothetical protein